MLGSTLKTVTTAVAAVPLELHEAGSQDRLGGRQLFESAVDLAADEGRVSRDVHGRLPSWAAAATEA